MAIQADKTNTAVIVTMFAVGAAAMLGGSAAIVGLTRGEIRKAKEQNSGYADLGRVRELRAQQAKQLTGAKLPIDKARLLVLQQIQRDPNAASPLTPPPVEAAGGAGGAAESGVGGAAPAGGAAPVGGAAAAAPSGAAAVASGVPASTAAPTGKHAAPAPKKRGTKKAAARMRFLPILRARLRVALLGISLVLLTCASVCAAPTVAKDRTEAMPGRLDGVAVEEHLGETLPLDRELVNSDGQKVTLRGLMDGTRPTLLTFNYSNCPMLCSLQLNRFVGALKQLKRTAGEDFQIVTISIDPAETPERAAETKQRYLRDYGRPEAAAGWHFLLGTEASVRDIAGAAGFGYQFNEERKEWLHAAVLMVLTPEGTLARYLYGIEYHPETLNLSIVDASEGKIGSTVEHLLLYCFHYDETEGRYAPVAMNVMRVGAGGAGVALGGLLAFYWLGESRKKRKALAPSTAS